jgi:branched-subunit amino acid ABC-type transport system permease component
VTGRPGRLSGPARWLAVLACLAGLAGCAGPTDPDQLRICRFVLEALHPDGTVLRETGRSTGAMDAPGVRQSLVLDYEALEPAAAWRRHRVECGFAGQGFERRRIVLAAVTLDGVPLREARFFYLVHWWLPAVTGDPPTGRPDLSALPELSLTTAYTIQQTINALTLSAIYALLATAYSLIYGLMSRIAFSFGEMAVAGGYAALTVAGIATVAGVGSLAVILMWMLAHAVVVGALTAFAVGQLVVAPLDARHKAGQPILVATLACGIFLQEFLRLTQGSDIKQLRPIFAEPMPLAKAGTFLVTTTPIQIAVVTVAVLSALAVIVIMARSRFGRAWRAYADDPVAALIFGVNRGRLIAGTFLMAGTLAAIAGWIVVVYYGTLGSTAGVALGLKALVAAIVGGIGSIPGAFVGGLLIGYLETFWSAWFDVASRDIVVFSILVAVFVLRPGGLFGYQERGPRMV